VDALPAVAVPEKFEPGCSEGRATDCFLAGYEWERKAAQARLQPHDEAAQPLYATAIKAFARGCELGDARSCSSMANDIEHGIGAERDVAAAVQLFEKACALGEGLGCRHAANMHETGRRARLQTLQPQPIPTTPKADVPKNAPRAVEYHGRACEHDDPEACYIAARLLAAGEGIEVDRTKSLALFSRACRDGMVLACTDAAALGGDQAADFQRRACALSDKVACGPAAK
jgi:TPR repeat protein